LLVTMKASSPGPAMPLSITASALAATSICGLSPHVVLMDMLSRRFGALKAPESGGWFTASKFSCQTTEFV
jgi:hypothetical protein